MSYAVIIRTISIVALLLAVTFPLFDSALAHAQSGDTTGKDVLPAITIGPDQDRDFEKRAQSLEKQLICPICPGETLDQSFVQISQDMKRILREKLQAGQDEGQIKEFFAARYGTSVLAAPPRTGFNLVTWIVPPIGIALGVVGLFFVMRQMRRGSVNPVAAGVGGMISGDSVDGELDDYLAEVDRDLATDDSLDGDQCDDNDRSSEA
ncbi:MAG: cytochrome c-type biogenesis protein CcmH [Dehalococcoidia bacterium]|nr:cytochrome c-type biogenesis protein CcmH [Dehalococcoidia bacterium]